jgi:hypothetical protein
VRAGLELPPATDDFHQSRNGHRAGRSRVVEIVASESEFLHDRVRKGPTVPLLSGAIIVVSRSRRRSDTGAISLRRQLRSLPVPRPVGQLLRRP